MTSAKFKDHFSSNSNSYRKFRPTYPEAMFDYLASMAPGRSLAWDCGTGSGQAVAHLVRYFARVIATDASRQQIENAKPLANVEYKAAPAEDAPIQSNSVDAITVAQALHWFDIERFFREAERVLRPNGIIAVWSYNLLSITPAIDAIINTFYHEILGPYWPAERRLVETDYKTIPFPFTRVTCPDFSMTAEWSLEDLSGYLGTWSAVKRYQDQNGANPVGMIQAALTREWGNQADRHKVAWPLSTMIGRNSR